MRKCQKNIAENNILVCARELVRAWVLVCCVCMWVCVCVCVVTYLMRSESGLKFSLQEDKAKNEKWCTQFRGSKTNVKKSNAAEEMPRFKKCRQAREIKVACTYIFYIALLAMRNVRERQREISKKNRGRGGEATSSSRCPSCFGTRLARCTAKLH